MMSTRIRLLSKCICLTVLCTSAVHSKGYSQTTKSDSLQLTLTSDSIRAAFFNSDAKAAMRFHHPDVVKATGPDKLLVGREAVEQDLTNTLENFDLEFGDNIVEVWQIVGDVSYQQIVFSLRGTPKDGGEGWLFSGRTVVVSVRYDKSPTGWAIIHEIIQPGPIIR